MGRRLGVLIAGVALCAVLIATPAHAAFPGANGKIAYVSSQDGNEEIYSINPDGTNAVRLTINAAADSHPAWSPDGSKIAFVSTRDDANPATCSPCNTEIYVMNSDGSNVQRLTTNAGQDTQPEWSPDGTMIAFKRFQLWRMNADGTNAIQLTTNAQFSNGAFSPAWSPDGRWIAFLGSDGSLQLQYLIQPDATGLHVFDGGDNADWSPDGQTMLMDHQPNIFRRAVAGGSYHEYGCCGFAPAWSPDGTKIVFMETADSVTYSVKLMDVDGSNVEVLVTNAHVRPDFPGPDWQPIPINAYVRPIATEPLKATMAVAYEPCTSPNRTHGPPLDSPSCAPPVKSSSQLTVGTFDANGLNPKATANVILSQIVGNPNTPADEADIGLHAEATDVRLASDLSDYTGSLEARMTLRITDKDNTPSPGGPGAATVSDFPYSFSVPCASTPDGGVGSSCGVDTSADALVPGTVKEKRRSVWALGQVALRDGAGNAFMRQGLFVP